jgi:cytochrome c oxidase cbb3-type subunit 4
MAILAMTIDTFRGIVTGVLLLLFLWLIAWAWSKRRQQAFDIAARAPLDDEGPAP